MNKKFIIILAIYFILLNTAFSKNTIPQLFLFLGSDNASSHLGLLNNPCVRGAQIIYSWKELEPQKNNYDFSSIEQDLATLKKAHKQLFIQLQDRSFQPDIFNVPDYIREDPIYHGGVAMQYDMPGEGKPIATGWIARVWDPAVRARFQLLIKQLAVRFDGKIAGINLPETAIDLDPNNLPSDFTSDKYVAGELENIKIARQAFQKSRVIQYINFFPDEWHNDHQYMSQFFSYAQKHHIGLGGPDVVPYKPAHMKNSYPYFHQFKHELFIAMAIQEPDYTYTNPDTGKPYSFTEFYEFAENYLGADILFWNIEEPFFSHELAPHMNEKYFLGEKVTAQPLLIS